MNSTEQDPQQGYYMQDEQVDEPKAKYQINVEKQAASQQEQQNTKQKKEGICSRFFGATKAVLRRLDPFQPLLRLIESRFGGAVMSYFLFVRYLFFINLVVMLLFLPLIFPAWQSDYGSSCSYALNSTTPTSGNVTRYYGAEAQTCSRSYTESIISNKTDIIQLAFDLLQGTGFVERSFAFLGYYCVKESYRTDLAFIFLLFLAYLINFVIIVIESSRFFRKLALSLHAEYGSSFTNNVFAGWDFVIAEKQAALRRRRIWRNEIERMCRTQREAAARGLLSSKENLKIVLIRVLVTFIIIVLQIGSAACIVAARELASDQLRELASLPESNSLKFWILLFFEYFPSLVLSALNIVVPTIFRILLGLCSLTDDWQIRLRIVSTVILRVFSLCVLVVNIFRSINYCSVPKEFWSCGVCNSTSSACWETYFGQQMYKLMVLDLLLKLALWLALEVPRKLLSNIKKLKFITPNEFDIPTVVLDLVYLQTLCWLGMFFAPVLPLILFVGYIYIFGLMTISVFYTSSTESSMQTSKSTTFFAFVLSLLFAVILLPVGTAISKFQPSQSCSPFRVWLKEDYTIIDSLLLWFSDSTSGVLNEAQKFSVTILWTIVLSLIVGYFWFRSQIQRKRHNIDSLQVKLSKIGKDKQFLVDRLLEFNAFTGKS